MLELLTQLYGKNQAPGILKEIHALIDLFRDNTPSGQSGNPGRYTFTEKDIVLITYPDQVINNQDSPLSVLLTFLKTFVQDTINTIHILPFFPYSSDDGFSIIDFYEADPHYGGWQGIKDICTHYNLMCDLVLNHISAKSRWFRGFLNNEAEYKNYFITCDPDTDLTEVTRPRPYPLLTPFACGERKKWLWTTFSEDQIDLNFKEPKVLLEMIKILLTYVRKGARIVRLDAIAYIWKELGTTCIHRPEVHAIVKLFRKILDNLYPRVVLITETNVPHKENISYFGSGVDEAQMVYQFSLPPLVIHGLLNENASYLTSWASTLRIPETGATYFNFTASHDGIGVRPLTGLVPEADIDALVKITRQRGGEVSYKTDKDGKNSPYELNINYLSMLTHPGEDDSLSIKRFLVSQSIMLTMPGVPGIYFHSLIGSINDSESLKKTRIPRSINREKLKLDILTRELETLRRRKDVYEPYMKMLRIRTHEPALHPQTPFRVLHVHEKVFAFKRIQKNGPSLIVIHNMSSVPLTITVTPESFGRPETYTCLLSLLTIKGNKDAPFSVDLSPYQYIWLKEDE
ncbi:MAG: sugar phosphorylase [Spirochaetales bacterium]|nr:sugar phosphorylase [Spirochaetales bacterium]